MKPHIHAIGTFCLDLFALFGGNEELFDTKKCPPNLLHDFGSFGQPASLCPANFMSLFGNS